MSAVSPPVSAATSGAADAAPGLARRLANAAEAAQTLCAEAQTAVRNRLGDPAGTGGPSARMEQEQFALHGLAWFATTAEVLRQVAAHAARLDSTGQMNELDALLLQTAAAEYLAQLDGGVPMNQGEIVRPDDLGIPAAARRALWTDDARTLRQAAAQPAARMRIARLLADAYSGDGVTAGHAGLDDTLNAMRTQMRRFAAQDIQPHAHGWHLRNDYIPLDVIRGMADMGVFRLTTPEADGGMGLGKESMCVVSEELSRASLAAGSLGTRTEIAAELILTSGTPEQKARWLPGLTAGDILPTAVFTEPDAGSDLASLRTRAVRDGGVYRITGAKTWATHAARADLMTLLVRTGAQGDGHRGLSLFLAEKPRGTDETPFPAPGMSGSEIQVLGYRGMKEFEIAFDGFEVGAENLLGGVEGQGFKQLMRTFETARIQTAARAVGVAQAALDQALRYALERRQFGRPLLDFPRTAAKIALMAAELAAVRQLTYFAARTRDSGKRCDLEAGMAKLLAARAAWTAADNAVQIHGGNGFALEYPVSRLLCDARILSIFEGAAEIQAQVIARRLLDRSN